jgi:hypothetical protein
MGLNSNQRNYNLTDADLMMFASNLVQTINRDALQFADFGVDDAAITAFETLGNQFETFPPDTFYLADISIATEAKDNARQTLLLEIRKIANRALAKWGENSAQYRKFGVKGIIDINDKALLATARLIVSTATGYIAELTADGLTQDVVDDYETVAQEFEDSLNALNSAIEIRDKKTKDRIALGNQLYALVTKYCSFGKSIWDKVDEAYFNDYIIYSVPPGSLSAPQGLRFDFPNLAFYWEMVENASSYQVEASIDGTNYFEIYSGSDLVCAYTPIQENFMWYRVRARNANGFGPYSDVLKQGYYAGTILPSPSNLAVELVSGTANSVKLTWDEVPSAIRYKIFKSIVAVGDPVGANSNIEQVDTNEFIDTVDSGHRYYYHVTAENGNQWSPVTSDVWIDVN